MLALVQSRGGDAALDGGIFGRQAERVPADGVQHVEAAHAPVTRHGVADGVIAHVAHVQRAGGIRQHLEQIIFRPRGIGVGANAPARPILLPLCSTAWGSYSATMDLASRMRPRPWGSAWHASRDSRGSLSSPTRAALARAARPRRYMLKPFCARAPASPRSPPVPIPRAHCGGRRPARRWAFPEMNARVPGRCPLRTAAARQHERADALRNAAERAEADPAVAFADVRRAGPRANRTASSNHSRAARPRDRAPRCDRAPQSSPQAPPRCGFRSPPRNACAVSRQTPSGSPAPRRESRAVPRSATQPPMPMPEVFSINSASRRARIVEAPSQSRMPRAACRIACATSRIACSELLPVPGVFPQQDPGCTTR